MDNVQINGRSGTRATMQCAYSGQTGLPISWELAHAQRNEQHANQRSRLACQTSSTLDLVYCAI
eukprot:3338235-Lingulodinium_polyedra.AAC.1